MTIRKYLICIVFCSVALVVASCEGVARPAAELVTDSPSLDAGDEAGPDAGSSVTRVTVEALVLRKGERASTRLLISPVARTAFTLEFNPLDTTAQHLLDSQALPARLEVQAGESERSILVSLADDVVLPATSARFELRSATPLEASVFEVTVLGAWPRISVQHTESIAGQPASIGVSLSEAASVEARLDWQLQADTAVDLELVSPLHGTLTFGAGVQQREIVVEVASFVAFAQPKLFRLEFSNLENVRAPSVERDALTVVDQKPHLEPSFAVPLADLRTRNLSQPFELNVSVSGSPAPTLQWFVDGRATGATTSTLTLPAPNDAKTYSVRVVATNVFGEASSSATITFACESNESPDAGACIVNTTRACFIEHGVGQESWQIDHWAACAIVSCDSGFVIDNGQCVCAPQTHLENSACVSDRAACSVPNGKGYKLWAGGAYGPCLVESCNPTFVVMGGQCVCPSGQVVKGTTCACPDGQHLEAGTCTSDIASCPIVHGTGTKVWTGAAYGPCQVASCDATFSNVNGVCTCLAEQVLDTDGLCKYQIRTWVKLYESSPGQVPVRCVGVGAWDRPVNGIYHVGTAIYAGGTPWMDPNTLDPNFSAQTIRIAESSTCGGEYSYGGTVGGQTICYARDCNYRLFTAQIVLSTTK